MIEVPAAAQKTANDRLLQLAIAIAHREGYGVATNLPARLNNPGDLLFAKQPGAKPFAVTGKDDKVRIYAKFATAVQGWFALFAQIRLDASRGKTLEQFIDKYAPASDGNDPASYISFVMRAIGCQNPEAKLSDLIA